MIPQRYVILYIVVFYLYYLLLYIFISLCSSGPVESPDEVDPVESLSGVWAHRHPDNTDSESSVEDSELPNQTLHTQLSANRSEPTEPLANQDPSTGLEEIDINQSEHSRDVREFDPFQLDDLAEVGLITIHHTSIHGCLALVQSPTGGVKQGCTTSLALEPG